MQTWKVRFFFLLLFVYLIFSFISWHYYAHRVFKWEEHSNSNSVKLKFSLSLLISPNLYKLSQLHPLKLCPVNRSYQKHLCTGIQIFHHLDLHNHAELSGQAALSVALPHVPNASTETEQQQEQSKKHWNACISSDLLKI